jgi:hypothetical protein
MSDRVIKALVAMHLGVACTTNVVDCARAGLRRRPIALDGHVLYRHCPTPAAIAFFCSGTFCQTLLDMPRLSTGSMSSVLVAIF